MIHYILLKKAHILILDITENQRKDQVFKQYLQITHILCAFKVKHQALLLTV